MEQDKVKGQESAVEANMRALFEFILTPLAQVTRVPQTRELVEWLGAPLDADEKAARVSALMALASTIAVSNDTLLETHLVALQTALQQIKRGSSVVGIPQKES